MRCPRLLAALAGAFGGVGCCWRSICDAFNFVGAGPVARDDPDMQADGRAIRVFVSSTFRDMQAERDELVKRVFPQLRRLCEQRGVAWSEVDLRWGVTDEQAAEGAVLPICLAEIERTRPYFIGLLGQRYGWVPDEVPAALVEQLGWLGDEAGKRSVTELEILHGVLNDPAGAGHAYFYLRDPAWVTALPEAERGLYVEPTAEGAARLDALRARVRTSGYPVAEYGSPQHLGDAVLADFVALIEGLYPAADVPDGGTRADAVHASFAQARFGLHVPRPAVEGDLDAAAAGPPLLVTGPPGAGASSLVATWATRWAAEHPDARVLVHHCDAGAEAADFRSLAARVVAALDPATAYSEALDALAGAAPAHVGAEVLRAARASASAGRDALVVLDGVDRLDEGAPGDRAPDLRWLAPGLSDVAGVQVVVTSAGERARAAFDHRGWPVLEVPELTPDERRAIASTVLAVGAKALDSANLAALVGAPGTGNARFLRTVVDELRQHGDHFTLRDRLDQLTAADSVDDLLELVLARYESDFERDRPGLVGDAMRALWAARHGLAEAELLDLLEPGPDHLPQRVWAPLHLAAEHGIVSRGGLLGFAHSDLRRAVEDRYLADERARRAAHAVLAGYFAEQPLGPRQADELAWQQAQAGDLPALRTTLANPGWAELAYTRHPADLRRLWAQLGGDAGLAGVAAEMVTAYAAVSVADAGPSGQLAWGVARLLADAGATDAAMALQRRLVDTADSDAARRAALVNLGALQLQRGELDSAGDTFERVTAGGAPGDEYLAAALANLAVVRRDQRRYDEADAHFAQADALQTAAGRLADVQANLSGWGELKRRQVDYTGAQELFRRQEQICRELADPVGVGRALAGQAIVLADQGRAGEALIALDEFAAIARAEGDLRGLTEALLSTSVTRGQVGDTAGADAAAREAEPLARRFGDPALLAKVLVTRANQAGATGDWGAAEQLAREAELTARAAHVPADVALALGIVGTARRELGDLAGARAVHEQEAAVAAELGDGLATATADANLGNVAIAEQRFDAALEHYASAEAALRESGNTAMLLPILANRAQIHHHHQRFAEALADYADAAVVADRAGNMPAAAQWGQVAIQLAYQLGDVGRAEVVWGVLAGVARAGGDQAGLQRALGEQALMLINRGAFDAATELLDEQESVCRALGDPVGLAQCVGNRAIVLRHRGDLAGSLACLDEQLRLASESGNAQGALIATANRGEVLGLLGRTGEALQALQSARASAAQYGVAPMVQQLDQMIAALQN
jgi:tetratricopeptide (TPR) repeat protein